jgi:hypothetical protein
MSAIGTGPILVILPAADHSFIVIRSAEDLLVQSP